MLINVIDRRQWPIIRSPLYSGLASLLILRLRVDCAARIADERVSSSAAAIAFAFTRLSFYVKAHTVSSLIVCCLPPHQQRVTSTSRCQKRPRNRLVFSVLACLFRKSKHALRTVSSILQILQTPGDSSTNSLMFLNFSHAYRSSLFYSVSCSTVEAFLEAVKRNKRRAAWSVAMLSRKEADFQVLSLIDSQITGHKRQLLAVPFPNFGGKPAQREGFSVVLDDNSTSAHIDFCPAQRSIFVDFHVERWRRQRR